MATKEIKTRIALRTGDFAYWTTGAGKDIELIKGEVCICTVATADSQATTAPTVLFKVCDTTGKKFADLKWTSALAADVYPWAKEVALHQTTEAITATEGTKTYTGNALTKVEWDASLNDGKGGLKFTKEVQFATKAELDAAIAAFGGDLSNIVDTDTRYTFANDGDKLVVKKTLYTNGVAGTEEEVGTYEFLTVDEVNGILANYYTKADLEGKIHTEDEIKAMEIAHATAAGKVDNALTVKVGGADVVFDGSAAQTADVDAAIAAAIDAIPEVVHPEYSIVKDATSDYAATYHLTKDGVNVGAAINIPKDMVVEHGEVKELEAGVWGEAGTYIVITLANATDEKLYINVGNLIEYVTSGSATGDMVYVTVDPTTHKVTATITDGTVTEAKLHADVTAKLNKEWDAKGAAATAEQNAKDYADGLVEGYGDIVTHNAAEFATNAENGAKALADANKLAIDAINNVDTGILAQAKAYSDSLNHEDTKYTAAPDGGLKLTENNEFAIDEAVVFILDCNW